ncbi:hypothetical protein FB566_3013 [Stackebrandtia endophytica]|uniref:Uncharacterized protein n=1 Tax=Stackebrandtia endophytica TaxID=1496996 RepID=A0A543AXZ1_9ACTN|nr:hypothetical protein [Stackebrandtia endophytica]TQL77454.1 hypothetical protein FB566_3013 [Stackebrandtia endophytica]
MTSLRERIQRLDVEATSADEAVHARLSAGRGIEVTFDQSVLEDHDEESLGYQIEEVLSDVVQGAREFAASIRGGGASDTSRISERDRLVNAAIDDIDLTVTSPRGLMVIDWLGQSGFVVTFHPQAFDKYDHASLTGDVNATVFAISHLRKRKTMEIHRNLYMSPTSS